MDDGFVAAGEQRETMGPWRKASLNSGNVRTASYTIAGIKPVSTFVQRSSPAPASKASPFNCR